MASPHENEVPELASITFSPKEDFPDLDPGAVCLAVLTSLLQLLLEVLRFQAKRRGYAFTRAGWAGPRVARPPPRSVALRLTRVSVLRI